MSILEVRCLVDNLFFLCFLAKVRYRTASSDPGTPMHDKHHSRPPSLHAQAAFLRSQWITHDSAVGGSDQKGVRMNEGVGAAVLQSHRAQATLQGQQYGSMRVGGGGEEGAIGAVYPVGGKGAGASERSEAQVRLGDPSVVIRALITEWRILGSHRADS